MTASASVARNFATGVQPSLIATAITPAHCAASTSSSESPTCTTDVAVARYLMSTPDRLLRTCLLRAEPLLRTRLSARPKQQRSGHRTTGNFSTYARKSHVLSCCGPDLSARACGTRRAR